MAMAQPTTAPCRQKGMTTRRNLLATLPMMGVLSVPAAVNAQGGSIFRDTYRAWEEARHAYDSCPGDLDGDDAKVAYARLISIEDAMSALRPSTLEDFAYKILVADNGGDMDTNVHQVALVEEARRLTGVAA